MSDFKFHTPNSWILSSLPDIAGINMGQSPSSSDVNEQSEGIVFFQGKAEFGKLYPTPRKYCTKPTKIASAGDILLSIRAPVGPTNIATETTAIGRGLAAISAHSGLTDPKYLLYYFRCIEPWLSTQGTGSTFKAISGQFIKELKAPLPSFAEQKIIAEKLDILLAQVDSTKARLEQIPQILKRFRQAVLAAAVNGKLADRLDGNRHWQEQQLSHVASHIVDCPHSTPKWSSEGKYCVRTTAFSPFYLDLSYQGYVDEETYQNRIQRLKPEPDDILYSREGTIGIACQIPKGVELCLGQRMVLIRASDKISSKYLTIVLNSNNILKIVRSKTMGSTAPRINMSDIKSYPIPLPPLQEQHEIVRRVELLFAYADTIEKQVNSTLTRVNSLTQSILAKAFRGELTAQWRAENPDLISGENSAAALLEKIKAERAASGGKKTSRKKA
ncbi:restriction endonuclease subunit S [Citrobacter amalonaticus]|nr:MULTISPECIES: restriction endonuclease subunit S [Citrobacter]MBJ9865055.1 restriction endonuclease subunit S [Citrobacter amalonaticus]MDU7775418.1 restriction endonuclease subunit S [Citrobacter sp.]